jgi:uncharacterized protein YprB with RNaseH-like and TPR domain
MITNSFILLPRISHTAEQNLWQNGITDWDRFIGASRIPGISPKRKHYFARQLKQAQHNLQDHNSSYFASKLPQSETWRLYNHFQDDCIFLDIETSGYYGDITVIGLYNGDDVVTLVKHRSLDKYNLMRALKDCKLLVTFNGASFDIPVINRFFNSIIPKIPHLDLRSPLHRLGFTGGLKKIEQELDIRRSNNTDGMSGEEAVHLWHDYIATGNTGSLDLLVEYNTEDIVNLKPIAGFVFSEMKKRSLQHFA